MEDLYNEPDESWIEISNQAAEILYGVGSTQILGIGNL